MKIIHIITGLNDGGAEHTLYKVCKYDTLNNHIVISLTGPGKYYSLLKQLKVKVFYLNASFLSIHKFYTLIKLIRFFKPEIVQTWLVHADLIGSIAAKLACCDKIIWNVRYSDFKIGKAKLPTIIIVKILSKFSFFLPIKIVINSKKAKKIYEIEGYDKKKLHYIPNGYDLSILKPNNLKKINFKKKYSLKKNIPLIGNIARFDPKKDHINLIKALSLVRLKNSNFLGIFLGSGIDNDNKLLVSEIKKLNLSKNIKLIGQNNNIAEAMNGIDIYVQSSSYGEGFPNVVAEAMSCGTPCVVTDVGDAALIAKKSGWVVPPNNPKKLANAIEKALIETGNIRHKKRSVKARSIIKSKFDIKNMLNLYNKLWNKVYKCKSY